MILGVGVDLVDIARMQRSLSSRWSHRFIQRVFSPHEIEVCTRAPHPGQAFAARFAAKEAVAKAMGTGFSQGVTPGQIRVLGGETRPPSIELTGRSLIHARSLHVRSIHVSLTHTSTSACALVVIENG